MSVPDRPQGDRRNSNGSVWIEKRQSDRRVSPAVGEFAIQENARLREVNAELLEALQACVARLDDAIQVQSQTESDPGGYMSQWDSEAADDCAVARAAIKKATGNE